MFKLFERDWHKGNSPGLFLGYYKNFPRGAVKQIHEMGLVQKDGLDYYVTASANRLTCVSIDRVNEIMLTEYKAQVSPDRAQLEQDCIDELRMTVIFLKCSPGLETLQ